VNRQGIAEILKTISGIKNFQERQNALGTCVEIQPLMQVLHATFHPEVKFLLPEGAPPFKKLEKSQDAQGTLYREAKTLKYFIEGIAPPMHDLKRQSLFVQLLESLDPDDADLILAMKDKKSLYPSITYELVKKTFPNFLPEPPELTEEEKRAKRKNAVPCPFGCVSTAEDGLFLPGPLAQHIARNHPDGSSTDEHEEEPEE